MTYRVFKNPDPDAPAQERPPNFGRRNAPSDPMRSSPTLSVAKAILLTIGAAYLAFEIVCVI